MPVFSSYADVSCAHRRFFGDPPQTLGRVQTLHLEKNAGAFFRYF